MKRKENNKLYAVKYLHKNKLATIEDASVIIGIYNSLSISNSLKYLASPI